MAMKRVLDRGQVPALSEKADRNLGQVRNADALGFGQPAAPCTQPAQFDILRPLHDRQVSDSMRALALGLA